MKSQFQAASLYYALSTFCALGFSSAWAQNYAADPASLLGPKSAGRGGATVASENDHEAIYQNIASAGFAQKYTVTGAYIGAGDALSVSVVDTKSGPVGGAISYLHRELKNNLGENTALGNYRRNEERATGSLFGRISEELAVGGTFKYAYRRSMTAAIANQKSLNFDLGAKYLASSKLAFGLSGQNLMADESGLDLRVVNFGGEFVAAPGFTLSAQISKNSLPEAASGLTLPLADKTMSWAMGGQYKYSDFAFRAGFSDHAAWNLKIFSLGLGYVLKNFSLDYSFEKGTAANSFYLHSVSLSAFL